MKIVPKCFSPNPLHLFKSFSLTSTFDLIKLNISDYKIVPDTNNCNLTIYRYIFKADDLNNNSLDSPPPPKYSSKYRDNCLLTRDAILNFYWTKYSKV